MKEATGEASMTGITIAIIGAVVVVAIPLVRMVINNIQNQACCSSIGGTLDGGACKDTNGTEIQNWKENCKTTE